MTFPEVLKSIRKQCNYTQEQFARELNVSFSTINRWENGRSVPSVLAKIQLLEYCKRKCIDEQIIAELTNFQV